MKKTEEINWHYKQKPIQRLAHAIQSGVAAWMEYNPKETQAKHLRVGVNMAMLEIAALTQTLVEAEIIELETVRNNQITLMLLEIQSYEKMLSEKLGKTVSLG